MDMVLRRRLPLELVEIIMRYVHEMNMLATQYILTNNLVWIHTHAEGYSYLISENISYYAPLIQNPYLAYSPLTRSQLKKAKKRKALCWN
jgi:hypothetical protein